MLFSYLFVYFTVSMCTLSAAAATDIYVQLLWSFFHLYTCTDLCIWRQKSQSLSNFFWLIVVWFSNRYSNFVSYKIWQVSLYLCLSLSDCRMSCFSMFMSQIGSFVTIKCEQIRNKWKDMPCSWIAYHGNCGSFSLFVFIFLFLFRITLSTFGQQMFG